MVCCSSGHFTHGEVTLMATPIAMPPLHVYMNPEMREKHSTAEILKSTPINMEENWYVNIIKFTEDVCSLKLTFHYRLL
jgi:hypothetical protein